VAADVYAFAAKSEKKMETQKMERELLRGKVDPPTALASRTCAKIWQTLDSEKQDPAPNSSIFLDSAFLSPESILPPSFLLQTFEPDTSKSDEGKREIPKAGEKLETEEDEERPPRSSHWIGLIASVSVGMVIAVFLFPMLEFAKRSTRSYVAESWMTEINRRVDQYEQIHGNTSRSEELQPLNLALSGWQELSSEAFVSSLLLFGNAPSGEQTLKEAMGEQQPLRWADLEGVDASIPFEITGLSEPLLLSIPRSWEGTARSAHGKDVLIKDGRVFFRILPNREQ
jgi:hypothetical protein